MIVGIDLGTTNSLVSVWTDEGVKLIPNEFGEYLTPSVVSFGKETYVGKTAKEMLITKPENTFKEFKRLMGKDVKLKREDGGSVTPIELSATIIRKLVNDAEKYLNEEVTEAVISVPAYFDDHQREATRLAGVKAGIKVTQLVNEPSAAALAYHIRNMDEDERFIVFDFGGGTLDVTLVEAFDNMVEICNISGDNSLGGKDFNEAIAIDICNKTGHDWNALNLKEQAVFIAFAENIKIALSSSDEVSAKVNIEDKEYNYSLTQQELIDLSEPIFKRITVVLKKLMNDSMLNIEDISGVIMVGGSSKMPCVRAYVSSLFGGKVHMDPEGDVSICKGAGVVTGINLRKEEVKDIVMTDICSFSLGIEILGDVMSVIIPKNQTLPVSRMHRYYTVGDNQSKIEINIYQGENHIASRNLLLDNFSISVPRLPKGEAFVDVRFSYDLNGIFDIDVHCPLNGASVHRSRGANMGVDSDYMDKLKLNMEELKQDPRELPEVKYVIERALRIFEEGNEYQKRAIEIELMRFDNVLETCRIPECQKAAAGFALRLKELEKTMFRFDAETDDLWDDILK